MAPDGTGAGAGFTTSDFDDEEEGKRGPAQRDKVIDAVLGAGITFWRDLDGIAFATVPGKDGEIGRYRVRSTVFRNVIRSIYAVKRPVKTGNGTRPGSIGDNAMREVLPSFEAMAFVGGVRFPDVRALKDAGGVWLDLGDDTWRAVRITAAGWKIHEATEAPLIRPEGQRALPPPAIADPAGMSLPLYSLQSVDNNGYDTIRHEGLKRLQNLLNLGSKDDLRLVVAWLLAALYPVGPYPILAVDGEQGSGKSTACRMLRRLVDPNKADLRAMARNEDDIVIAATNGRVVAFDNVSYIEPEMADALCRLATGAGIGKRRLYSDSEEHITAVARPLLLNGIPSLLARGDLADRAITVTLPAIPDGARKAENEIWQAFDEAAPIILGALLDGMVVALRRLPTIRLPWLPRMADFAKLICAAAPAFGWTEEQMLAALEVNRAQAVTGIVEADGVASAVQAIAIEYPGGWKGTATELLLAIDDRTPEPLRRERSWPKDAARLTARLKRVAPALRRSGIEVEHIREPGSGRRVTTITTNPNNGKSASQASQRHTQEPNVRENNGLAVSDRDDGVTLNHDGRDAVTMRDACDAPLPGDVETSTDPAADRVEL